MGPARKIRSTMVMMVSMFNFFSQPIEAAIFVETWEQESVGDTITGIGAAGLENWKRTFGAGTEGDIMIDGGDKALRLNPSDTAPLGVTTIIGYPDESVAGYFSIRADVKVVSEGTGNAYIFAANQLDVTTGYLLTINPVAHTLAVERSVAGVPTVLGAAFNAPALNYFIYHNYEARGMIMNPGPSEYLQIDVLVDGSLLFSRNDADPLGFSGAIKGGLLATGGRTAIFDNLIASTAIPGDMNGDRVVTIADLSLFARTLVNPEGATSFEKCAADVNDDLLQNGRDIDPFIDLLL